MQFHEFIKDQIFKSTEKTQLLKSIYEIRKNETKDVGEGLLVKAVSKYNWFELKLWYWTTAYRWVNQTSWTYWWLRDVKPVVKYKLRILDLPFVVSLANAQFNQVYRAASKKHMFTKTDIIQWWWIFFKGAWSYNTRRLKSFTNYKETIK